MAEIDNSVPTEHGLRIKPFDVVRNGWPIPSDGIFDEPTFQICVNRQWANRLASAISRLAWRDAWQGTDQEQQDAVEQINIFLAELMLSSNCENNTMNCQCIFPVQTTINYYSSTDILEQTVNEVFNQGDSIQNIVNQTGMDGVNAASDFLANSGMSDRSRCVASWYTLQYGRHIGSIATEAWLDKHVDWELVDTVSNVIGIAGGILSLFSFGTAAAVAGGLASIFDEAVYLAALEIMGDLSDDDIETAICELYNQMKEPTAAYFTFAGATFSNEIINGIWSDYATPDVYAGWLALASDPNLRDLSITCCDDCLTVYSSWVNVRTGHRNADLVSVRTEEVGTTTKNKKIIVRWEFSSPRTVTKASIVGIGRRYSNVLGLGYAAKVRTSEHPSVDLVNYDGSDIENAQLNQLTTYYAPESITELAPLDVTYIEFEIIWGVLIGGSSSEAARFEECWGIVYDINVCCEGCTWI